MDFDVDLNDVVDELLDRNKKLILENILLQKTLFKAATELDRLQAVENDARWAEEEASINTA